MKKKKNISSRDFIESLTSCEISVTGRSAEEAASNADGLLLEMLRKSLVDPQTKAELLNLPDPGETFREMFQKADNEVSDEDVFVLIRENHFYLGARFAQEKIERWQTEMYSTDQLLAAKAEDKLKRIGAALAVKGRGNARVPSTYVAAVRKTILQALKEGRILDKPYLRRTASIKEAFGVHLTNDELPDTYEELAHLITANLLGRSRHTVDADWKRAEQIQTASDFSTFRLKKSK